ncbi:TRAP transporter small permease [Clostridium sp.]|uniref:TRAP transporter small permease n=1 Tax=Clostridium sp. TaxID=1506 RepID=UPI003D6D135B
MNTKLFKAVDNIISWLIVFLMGSMAFIVIISVFLRYLFSITFIWSEELVSMIFITFSFLGCVVAIKEKEHISVDFLVKKFPFLIQKVAEILVIVIIIVMQAIIIKYSIGWIQTTGGCLSAGLRIPLGIYYSIMPISSTFIIIYEVLEIVDIINRKKVT